MKRLVNLFLAIAATLVISACDMGSSSEDVFVQRNALMTTYTNPYGVAAVEAFVGWEYLAPPAVSQNYLIYRLKSTGACTVYSLGATLSGQIKVEASPVDDLIMIGNSQWTQSVVCPTRTYAITQPHQTVAGTDYIWIDALGGNDVLNCSGTNQGDSTHKPTNYNYCSGGDGDDRLFVYGYAAQVSGDNGNDNFLLNGGLYQRVYAAGGDDCVEMPAGQVPEILDCGAGADKQAPARFGTGCETQVAHCSL